MFYFAKKEVLTTLSYDTFIHARDRLAAAGIPYSYRISDQAGFSRGRGGSFGVRGQTQQYYLYVRKKDYGPAARAVNPA